MRLHLFLLVPLVLISACIGHEPITKPEIQEQETSIEYVGGRYNGSIITIEGIVTKTNASYVRYDINYTKNNISMRNYFLPNIRPALDWIKENTVENSTFFNWWDYGHMIQGYTGRDVVIFSPSKDILWSVASGQWDETASGPLSSNEKIIDVAFALFSSDTKDLVNTMKKYNSEYAFVTEIDKTVVIYWLDKFHMEKYFEENELKEIVSELVLFKMLNEKEVEDFELVYSDNLVKIYKLS